MMSSSEMIVGRWYVQLAAIWHSCLGVWGSSVVRMPDS